MKKAIKKRNYQKVKRCRMCGNSNLKMVVNLGRQSLTGVFPKKKTEPVTIGPLCLVKCSGKDGCGLLQLGHSYSHSEMYGQNYGYRSGLNLSMVDHLKEIVADVIGLNILRKGDLVLDIGSNDGTMLNFFPEKYRLVGIDPTAFKFKHFYRKDVFAISDFFPSQIFDDQFGAKKAKIIFTIAMFYDLADPVRFTASVRDLLDDNGVWVLEQSYMPAMIKVNAYDTICHEHLEYYSMSQFKWLFDKLGLKIIDVQQNRTNGASIRLFVAKSVSKLRLNSRGVNKLLDNERNLGINTTSYYKKFGERINNHKKNLVKLLGDLKKNGALVLGYGASTKGNVILQHCHITPDLIPAIAEINEDKYGAFTPKTNIPIISEQEALARKPDYFLVLPWHFRENFLETKKKYLESGGHFIFPLPEIEIV